MRETLEIIYFISGPVIAVLAGLALWQLKIGAAQVRATKETAQLSAQREALRIAAEQTIDFAERTIPLWSEFAERRAKNEYPKLSAVIVEENWPTVQCKFDDLPGVLKEIDSNGALAIRILNRVEGFAMYFACGIADCDKAYRPVASVFCQIARTFLPYIIHANETQNHFTYTLSLYTLWGSQRFTEDTKKEIAKKSQAISKITLPSLQPLGTKPQ